MSDDSYVCTLNEASLEKAKKELQEDPKERLGAVETFRKWILEQPHLKCPTGMYKYALWGYYIIGLLQISVFPFATIRNQ